MRRKNGIKRKVERNASVKTIAAFVQYEYTTVARLRANMSHERSYADHPRRRKTTIPTLSQKVRDDPKLGLHMRQVKMELE